MPRMPQDVTDAEMAVLQVLWDQGPANRRQITDLLYPGGGPALYTTVQKLLERLEAKGYVTKDRGEGVRTFTAGPGHPPRLAGRGRFPRHPPAGVDAQLVAVGLLEAGYAAAVPCTAPHSRTCRRYDGGRCADGVVTTGAGASACRPSVAHPKILRRTTTKRNSRANSCAF